MNLEEAKANIGKEVIFKDSIFKNCDLGFIDILKSASKIVISNVEDKTNVIIKLFNKFNEMFVWCFVDPKHLKLKEKPMQNYKIKVTPKISAEAQELFFKLGYKWVTQEDDFQEPKYTNNRQYIFAYQGKMRLTAPLVSLRRFEEHENQEITLTQLRDLVVLKRNDVRDATHVGRVIGRFYRGFKDYVFEDGKWIELTLDNTSKLFLEQVNIATEMTWQDALRAVIDGKDVEFDSGFGKKDLSEYMDIHFEDCLFNLKPQTIHIDSGDYTKEELLKIAGEME